MLEISKLVPVFGGMNLDGASTVVILAGSVDTATLSMAIEERAARADPESDLRIFGFGSNRSYEFRNGRFNWAELFGWRRDANDSLPNDIVYTDINERENRIDIGVANEQGRLAAIHVVETLKIPPEAIRIGVVEAPVLNAMLIDSLAGYVRPTLSGLLITRTNIGVGTDNCTLGANVSLTSSSDAIFLTASHCTRTWFGLDATSPASMFYQPVLDYIHPEIAAKDRTDPAPVAGGTCPVGRFCRWSDAALATHTNPNDWLGGFIAFPGPGPIGSPFPFALRITINQLTPPPVGSAVAKVGVSTGYSTGQLARTCVNFNLAYLPAPFNTTLLCQNTATGQLSASGDSGGPVFRWAGFLPSTALFIGIHWGGSNPGSDTTVYSPVSGIKKDLGLLRYDLQ